MKHTDIFGDEYEFTIMNNSSGVFGPWFVSVAADGSRVSIYHDNLMAAIGKTFVDALDFFDGEHAGQDERDAYAFLTEWADRYNAKSEVSK